MKIVLQLFLITIITSRVDRKRGALLSCSGCCVGVKKQKRACFSVSVCEGGSGLSAPVANLPAASQDRMKHVLPVPPGVCGEQVGGLRGSLLSGC